MANHFSFTIKLILLWIFFSGVHSCLVPHCYSEDTVSNNEFRKAQTLFLSGNFAEATIAFYKLESDPQVTPDLRNSARDKFDACMALLRADQAQTDRFGSLISLQTSNQHMQNLIYYYVSLLEAQKRYNKVIEVSRFIYRMWPTAANKYTLAATLEKNGFQNDAFELYQELVSDKNYRTIVLRQMMESLKYAENGNMRFNQLANEYKSEIFENYDLLNSFISTSIWYGNASQMLEAALIMADHYPQSIDMLVYKTVPLCTNGQISVDLVDKLIKEPLSDEQRYLAAHIFAACGNINRAVEILGTSTSEKLLEYKAELFRNMGNSSMAMEIYNTLITKNGQNPIWYQNLADMAFKSGNNAAAKEYLMNYLRISQDTSFNAYFYVGRTLERYGFKEEAEKIYRDGKEKAKNKTAVGLELIKYYINQKKFNLAAKEIFESQKNVVIDPLQIYLFIKESFTDQLEVEFLIAELDKLVTQKGSTDELTEEMKKNLYYCLYVFSNEIMNVPLTMEYFSYYFKKASGVDPQVFALSSKFEKSGFKNEALEILELIHPGSIYYKQAIKKRTEILLSQGDMRQVTEIFSAYPDINDPYLLAKAYFLMGKIDKASDVVSHSSLNTPSITLLKGDILLWQRKFDDALAVYKTVPSVDREVYIKSLRSIGLLLLFKGDYDQALSVFRKVCEGYPDSGDIPELLRIRTIMALIGKDKKLLALWASAEFLSWKNDFDNALAQYTKLIDTNPGALYIPDILMTTYEVLRKANRTEEAVIPLDRLAREFPQSSLAPVARKITIALKNSPPDKKNSAYIDFLNSYPDSYDADLIREKLDQTEKQGQNTLP